MAALVRTVTALLRVWDYLSKATTTLMREMPCFGVLCPTRYRVLHAEGVLRVTTNRDGNGLHHE